MIDVRGGYFGNPAVETAGFKMIDVSRSSILYTKFHTARFDSYSDLGNFKNFLNLL